MFLGRHRFDLIQANLIPISVVFMIALGILIWFFLEYTRHGRLMYAIGSNAQAAALAGVPVRRYRIVAYMISGVFASIGGILLAARLGRGDIASGNNLLLDAVAAALIGFRGARGGQAERLRHGGRRAFSSASCCRG